MTSPTIRSIISISVAALLSATAFGAAPVLAQSKDKSKGDGDLADVIVAEAMELCLLLVDDDDALLDALDAKEYEYDTYTTGNKPYYQEIEGSRIIEDDGGEMNIWGFVEFYPNNQIGYCDFNYYGDTEVGVDRVNALANLSGETDSDDDGVYGMWEVTGTENFVLVHGFEDGSAFTMRLTQVHGR